MEMDRTAPEALETYFQALKEQPSDINEHLDLLRQLASECDHVTEMGMRTGTGSTVAFLAAQPATFIAWDINPYAIVSQQAANLLAMQGRTAFQPRVGDTLQITIEPTDFLFIDTLHTGKQLKAELERHGFSVRKYIAFHDTATFGYRDEVGEGSGLRAAIRWFQKEHAFPLWQLIEDRPNNNGLAVIKRVRD